MEAGFPVRPSTAAEVPSLMPLPIDDGFDWEGGIKERSQSRGTACALKLTDTDSPQSRVEHIPVDHAALGRQTSIAANGLDEIAQNSTSPLAAVGGGIDDDTGNQASKGLGKALLHDFEVQAASGEMGETRPSVSVNIRHAGDQKAGSVISLRVESE